MNRLCARTRGLKFSSKQKQTPAVIPAKAGIHRQYGAWIPAFAGMTAREGATLRTQVALASSKQETPHSASPKAAVNLSFQDNLRCVLAHCDIDLI